VTPPAAAADAASAPPLEPAAPPEPGEPGPIAPPTPAQPAAQSTEEQLPKPSEPPPPDRNMPFIPAPADAGPAAAPAPAATRPPPERPGAHVRVYRAVEASAHAIDGFSLHGGATLKQNGWGLEAALGFPYLDLRGQYGILDRLNVAAQFSSIYGLMNRYAVEGKFRIFQSEDGDFAVSTALQLSYSDYRDRARQETMWMLTGQRDFSIFPSLIASLRNGRGTHFWIGVGPDVTIDWEPPSSGPLSQVPPLFDVGFNVPLAVGAEVALTRHANFFFMLGVSLHLRREDPAPVMPVFALGIQFVL
jgi:hypothetical protein